MNDHYRLRIVGPSDRRLTHWFASSELRKARRSFHSLVTSFPRCHIVLRDMHTREVVLHHVPAPLSEDARGWSGSDCA